MHLGKKVVLIWSGMISFQVHLQGEDLKSNFVML